MRALKSFITRLPWPLRILVAILLFLALAGCGSQPVVTTPPQAEGSAAPEGSVAQAPALAAAEPTTPEDVHAAWLAGMEQQDREALLGVLAAQVPATGMDAKMGEMAALTSGESSQLGAYQSFEDLGVVEQGGRYVGFSRWSFESGTRCYKLTMAAEGAGWRATNWGPTEEGCE